MAVKKNCSKCGKKQVNVSKKGFNAKGQQRWKCSDCGKTFIVPGSKIVREGAGVKVPVKQKTKKVVKVTGKKPVEKKVKPSTVVKGIITTIQVNNNNVKTVERDITEDDAFKLVSDYFKEVTKTNVKTITDNDGNKTIQFQVKTGTKG